MKLNSEFMNYLAQLGEEDGADRLPALQELSKELQVSVSRLREQMEVARSMGLVAARPRTGIHRQPYTFSPAVKQSLAYAIALDSSYFESFADLRRHLEAVYWYEATASLSAEDKATLNTLVERAWQKLRGSPVQIPHAEHREFHLLIYRRLCNPFVYGLLEAYWDAYEAIGLNVYTDYNYLQLVWEYHQRMNDMILSGDLDAGYQALIEHADLIYSGPMSGERSTRKGYEHSPASNGHTEDTQTDLPASAILRAGLSKPPKVFL